MRISSLCEKDSAQNYQVTILPKTTLSLEGQQLNIGTRLSNFPRPFIDPLRMTPASVTMGFASNVAPDAISAAAQLASVRDKGLPQDEFDALMAQKLLELNKLFATYARTDTDVLMSQRLRSQQNAVVDIAPNSIRSCARPFSAA